MSFIEEYRMDCIQHCPDDFIPAAGFGGGAAGKNPESRPGYKEYLDKTNAFISWFPRNRQSEFYKYLVDRPARGTWHDLRITVTTQ